MFFSFASLTQIFKYSYACWKIEKKIHTIEFGSCSAEPFNGHYLTSLEPNLECMFFSFASLTRISEYSHACWKMEKKMKKFDFEKGSAQRFEFEHAGQGTLRLTARPRGKLVEIAFFCLLNMLVHYFYV